MDFVPHDEKIIEEMLKAVDVPSLEYLFKDIPEKIRIKKLELPPGKGEPDLIKHITRLANKNKVYTHTFLGAGCYYHYIPSLVDFVISRSEFYTSYTPYQAEASQGFLQAIYEYQTAITRLTGMDVANASMYDGSTALGEAMIMSEVITRKKKVILLEGIHPEYVKVVKTYCWGHDLEVNLIKSSQIEEKLSDEIGAIAFQNPNFFGEIENTKALVKNIREQNPKCLIIQVMSDPTCLGILKPPGDFDIDIFVAEGQPFGISPSFGGPSLGIFACKQKYLRKMPGRLVGKTNEINGDKQGFILTLQAREQHIRREKAISNICTNQALCMLAALVYLVSLGTNGLREIASQSIKKANLLKGKLSKLQGYEILNEKPIYNEFLVKCPNSNLLIKELEKAGCLPPLDISKYFPELTNTVLICVTELNTSHSIEEFVKVAQRISKTHGA